MVDNYTIFSKLRKTKNWTDGTVEAGRDWGFVIYRTRARLERIKKSMSGINDDCISIVDFKEVLKAQEKPELSYFVWLRQYNPLIVYSLSSTQKPTIFHIGLGMDSEDPTFEKYRPGMELNIPLEELNKNTTPILKNQVIRIDCRPKPTGGPGHYFFYKLPRDLRVCCQVFTE